MGVERAELIARMRGAFRAGVNVTKFIAGEKAAERFVGRRTDYLADWRTVNELEQKEGLLRFVRKDYYPTEKTMAAVTWETSKEYMYKVKVQSILKAGEPITERFVNIMSDVPMTPEMIESQVAESWGTYEKYGAEEIVGLQTWSAVRQVME